MPLVQGSRLKYGIIPAPMGGLNTVASGADMPVTDCLVLYNMAPAEYGLRTRLGWREHVTGLGAEVRSLLPFVGSHANGSTNRLFACTANGIWDVTGATTNPTRVLTFPIQSVDSGYGSSTVMVTLGGHFLVYCDEANGAFLYSESTDTWQAYVFQRDDPGLGQLGGSTGGIDVPPDKLAYVLAWKNMLWFVERDSARAWYLPIGQVSGVASAFTFGSKFPHGGDLRGLWSQTFDSGAGADDALVAVSGAGDVLRYLGTDPSQPSGFYLSGAYFIGGVPAGRRLCTTAGGDLGIISSRGFLSLSVLTSGAVLASPTYETVKVANLFTQAFATSSSVRGWGAVIHPADNALIVLVPTASGQPCDQIAMSLINKAWSRYRGLPMGPCAEAYDGTLYFGTVDGRVCTNDGYLDGVTLAGNAGSPIDFSLITGFSDLGRPTQKRIQILRPTFMSQGSPPQYRAEARYRWDLTEAIAPPSQTGTGSVFDTGTWDKVMWAGTYQAQQLVFGAQGMGPQVALAIRGTASARMTLVGIHVAYDEGGLL